MSLDLQELVERLVKNAHLMVELSRGVPEKQQIEELQAIQEALFCEIKQLEGKRLPNKAKSAQSKVIAERLALFQKLNQQFIANLSVRKDLIGADIGRLQIQQEMITQIQAAYSILPEKAPHIKTIR